MKILVAPDSFKGALSATEVAESLALGIEASGHGHTVEKLPLADGGEGSLDVVVSAGFTEYQALVVDACGAPKQASYALHDGHVFVEAAQAFGFIPNATPEQALGASSFGLGLLIADALRHNPHTVTVGVGGTAGTDAGVGALSALGWQFLDAVGKPVVLGGRGLAEIAEIRRPEPSDPVWSITWRVITDVVNPVVGPTGAAHVFAPQKGADGAAVELLDQGLLAFARLCDEGLSHIPGSGAGGGLAYGWMACLGASQASGASTLMSLVGCEEALRKADVVITGEGSFDHQSLSGKITGAVIEQARSAGVPVVVVCGVSSDVEVPDGVEVWQLIDKAHDTRDSLERTSELLVDVGRSLGEAFSSQS